MGASRTQGCTRLSAVKGTMESYFLNIAIAIVRGNTKNARGLIRSSPAFSAYDSSAIGKLQAALAEREERAVNRVLHGILAESLSLDIAEQNGRRADFLKGVRGVEDLIEKHITDAEPSESRLADVMDDLSDHA